MKTSLFSLRLFLKGIAILLLILMFAYTAQNSVRISKGNEQIQSRQLETLTKLLATQAAMSASSMIAGSDQERLLKLTNQLAQERLVFDATIYNSEGVKLASSSDAKSAREILGLDTPLETASIGRLQLVEPILDEDRLIGYVRITFEKGMVTAISDHHYRKSDRYMYLMIIMSFISGVLITLILRRKAKVRGDNLLLQNLKKPQ
ncbi:YtjB family periplasmic protein [Vibrio sp. SCSIO 43137]|uniref:YtjB family periplasmic protein n=1 Tax=Vibrio sp. SCSIO 43137 TaxID=3021011 RepID=UPI00230791F6|nr:YtjB family periplasmic protein [Vibrio sp. SCSIO 43137]WCE31282.1 YtjB family periplasmic protein [Vibrio sp. SCSIO 43137]